MKDKYIRTTFFHYVKVLFLFLVLLRTDTYAQVALSDTTLIPIDSKIRIAFILGLFSIFSMPALSSEQTSSDWNGVWEYQRYSYRIQYLPG
jgi:hypothetical protein